MSGSYWDGVAREMEGRYHLDEVMAEHKRRVHLDLLGGWCPVPPGGRVLKTDLFEEALGRDQVLLDWPSSEAGADVHGIDISREIALRARKRIAEGGRSARIGVSDARRLPYRDASFDVVFSCSTLDHFDDRADLLAGLREAVRVLRPGGRMVLTLDNPKALFYPAVRWLAGRGKIGFVLGETMEDGELRRFLPGLGLEVVEGGAVYHVPRVVFTAFLRILRALRMDFLDGLLLRLLRAAERGYGKPGQYRSGWYVAYHLRKPG
ncbi:MAG: class I SAM-dependent methyltransferase [Candidatus Eisenbacteria bacterium]